MEVRLKNQARIWWDELEQIRAWFGPFDIVEVFEEQRSDFGNRDWWAAADSLYDGWETHTERYHTDWDRFGLYQGFLYLLEKHGYATFDRDLSDTSSQEPLSLVERKPGPDLLEELYWDEGMSRGPIGLRYSVHPRLLDLWLYEEGIPLRRDNFDDRTQDKIDDLRGDVQDDDEDPDDDDSE